MVRPQKYSDEDLIELLKEVRSQVTVDVSPYLLEKHTGVSKSVWRNRMSQQIEKLNQSFTDPFSETKGDSNLPLLENVASIYSKYKDNEKVLNSKLNSYDVFVNNLMKQISQLNSIRSELERKDQMILYFAREKYIVLQSKIHKIASPFSLFLIR
ncbi:hypothetical protein ACKXGF_02565 [Alkalibacillus sp. S2W]|uniref:hypothetical protein n=1 Tax=Alkalibacillus sp. S2W TaxID=3386553 RepID=UPI00398D1A72